RARRPDRRHLAGLRPPQQGALAHQGGRAAGGGGAPVLERGAGTLRIRFRQPACSGPARPASRRGREHVRARRRRRRRAILRALNAAGARAQRRVSRVATSPGCDIVPRRHCRIAAPLTPHAAATAPWGLIMRVLALIALLSGLWLSTP